MSTDFDSDQAMVTSMIMADRGALAATVLREFDAVRRRVSSNLRGVSGASVGYDRLDVDWETMRRLDDGATVVVTAMVTASLPSRHRVEYMATTATSGVSSPRSVVLVRAQGWTLTPTSA